MSKADEIYLAIVDDIVKELDKYKYNSREELREEIESIKDDFLLNIESAFDEIEDNYADEKNINWEDDD